MKLKQIWIMTKAGLQLFKYALDSEIMGDRNFQRFGAIGIYNVLASLNSFLPDFDTREISSKNSSIVIYYEHAYSIPYLVASYAEIAPQFPRDPQIYKLSCFSRALSTEFYLQCSQSLEEFSNTCNQAHLVKQLEDFREHCQELVKVFEKEIYEFPIGQITLV